MQSLICNIKALIIKYKIFVIVFLAVYLIMFLLAIIVKIDSNIYDIFYNIVLNSIKKLLSQTDGIILSILYKSLISLFYFSLLFLVLTNKYTIYLSFLFVGYRGYILGLTIKIIVVNFGVTGIFVYFFLILLTSLINTILTILLFLIAYDNLKSGKCDDYIKFIFKKSFIAFIVSVGGIILQQFIILAFFKPIYLYL